VSRRTSLVVRWQRQFGAMNPESNRVVRVSMAVLGVKARTPRQGDDRCAGKIPLAPPRGSGLSEGYTTPPRLRALQPGRGYLSRRPRPASGVNPIHSRATARSPSVTLATTRRGERRSLVVVGRWPVQDHLRQSTTDVGSVGRVLTRLALTGLPRCAASPLAARHATIRGCDGPRGDGLRKPPKSVRLLARTFVREVGARRWR